MEHLKGMCFRCKDWNYIDLINNYYLCKKCQYIIKETLKKGKHCERCGYRRELCECIAKEIRRKVT